MEGVDAARSPLDTFRILQSQLGSFGVGVYEPSGSEKRSSEVADHHDHGVAQSGTAEDGENGFAGGAGRLAVVAGPLVTVGAVEDGGPAVVGGIPPPGRQVGQVGLDVPLVRTGEGYPDEPGALERQFPDALPCDHQMVFHHGSS